MTPSCAEIIPRRARLAVPAVARSADSIRIVADPVRRNTVLLTCAHAFAQVGFPVMLIVGLPAAHDLTGHDWASGLMWSVSFAAGALGAVVAGRWMDRVGRRPGLVTGFLMAAAAALGSALSIRAGSYAGLFLSTLVFGVGSGAANLVRGAVADMHPPERRGRAIGILLAAGTVGAIGGPALIPFVRSITDGRFDPDVIPWVIPVVAGLIAAGFVVAVRPDPRDLAHLEEDAHGIGVPSRTNRELLRMPAFRGALVAIAASQMVMVGVMGVTPNALKHFGHEPATPWVISGHIAGMYALAPLVGWLLDRRGRRVGLIAGLSTSAAGALLAGASSSPVGIGAGLFAVGLGWSVTFLAVTTVISDVTRADERAGALGFTDVVVLACSAGAALAGGFVLEVAGYGPLGAVGALVAVVAALWVGATRLEPAALTA
jgi:MFS family permease